MITTETPWTKIKAHDVVEFAPGSADQPARVQGTVRGTRISEGKPMLMIDAGERSYDVRPWNVRFVSHPG